MPSRAVLASIALILAAPILVASLGASEYAGLAIGFVLVVIGITSLVTGSRGGDDLDG